MEPFNEPINSGEDYANVLINRIKDIEASLPANQQQPSVLMNHWVEIIKTYAENSYTEYIVGKRETYLMTDEEMISTFQEAMNLYVNDLLGDLVDKDMLDVSVSENGELLYGLSDKGKEYVESGAKKLMDEHNDANKKKRGRPKKNK